ncbi:MAG: purine-nucleoside phosphorylase [Gemmatimonadaceae bacterium]
MRPYGSEAARNAAEAIRALIGDSIPELAIVLGSGLGGLVNDVQQSVAIPYNQIPDFPDVAIAGHAGKLVIGKISGRVAAVFAGRFHSYEGYPLQLTAFPIRVAHALGAQTLFVSNAAGGVNTDFKAGDLMAIEDHLNLTFASPLTGAAEPGEVRFPDMSDAYDPALRAALHKAAGKLGMVLRRGVYAMLPGPAYETPAEVRMLRTLGADAVGMSTVPEVTMARMLGMRVAGISCITNLAAGIDKRPLDHAEVLATTSRVAQQFQALVREFISLT